MNRQDTARVGPLTISSTLNPLINTDGNPVIAVEVLSSSSLTVTVQGHFGSGTVRNLRSFLLDGTSVETSLDPATTSATLAVQDVLLIPTCGAQQIQITRQAGSGTLGSTSFATAAMDSWLGAKSTARLSAIHTAVRKVDVDLVVNTDAYSVNDVLVATQVVSACTRANDVGGIFIGARLLDQDDKTEFDFDLVLLSADVEVGTINGVVDITDAEAENILGIVRYKIASNPSIDLVASKSYQIGPNHPDMPMPIFPVSGTDDIFVAIILRSTTPTFTDAGDLVLRMYFKDC